MKNIFATTAFALTIAAAGSVSAQTLSGVEEVTCAEFLAMELIDQETMLGEVIAESDGGSRANTTLADIELVCTGNDDTPVVDALDT